MKNKILSLLVLLLTAASGAWATDPKVYTEPVAMSQLQVGDILATGFSLTPASNLDVIYFDANRSKQDDSPMDSQWGVSLSYIKSYGDNSAMTFTTESDPPSDLTATPVDANGNDGNAWVVTSITNNKTPMGDVCVIYVSGTYYEPPITVEPVSGKTNEWTLSMPASDVVLTPIYAKAAAFATTGTEPEVKTLLPEAAEGVIAGTDASLIAEGTGIVAFAGTSTEVTQGRVMYAVTSTNQATAPALTSFSADVPTAKDIADDGADVLVWYYIQGADTPDGQQATADNTFNNSDVCTTPLTVSVRSNKFDLTLKAANANTVEAGKATVTVAGTAATVTDGKIKAVKMGSEVKMTAAQGYKFRKVEVKKTGSAVLAPALENGATVVIICNWGYATTTFTYTNNGGTFSGQASGYEAEYFHNGLELNGKNLSFGASNVDNSEYLSVGITFNTESSAYSYTGKGQDFVSFTISVNGTDVTSQLTEVK